MTTKTYTDLENLKNIYILSQFAPNTGLSETRPGANWDTLGLTETVPVSPARIVPVSPKLTSHEKYDLACGHGTASNGTAYNNGK